MLYIQIDASTGVIMTRAERVAKMTESADIGRVAAEKALGGFIAAVTEEIRAGDKVAFTGFGTFNATTEATRTGRKPVTWQEPQIAEKTSGKLSPRQGIEKYVRNKMRNSLLASYFFYEFSVK